jgi:zinc transport system substrate-binding protein
MYKYFSAFLLLLMVSCGRSGNKAEEKIITVSIAPFKYFVDRISGGEYNVNVMVPYGSDPHVYEPVPQQIIRLRKSSAYISNGYLAFETAWLRKFYEANNEMVKLSLGEKIDPLESAEKHDKHSEAADPHYWVSPKCAMIMAGSVKDLLNKLNPDRSRLYESNYYSLMKEIKGIDSLALKMLSEGRRKTFMIFHPNLGYMARDYGLKEISLEHEGKEPSAARMKELVDIAKSEGIRTVFIQKEYDVRNAKTIADEIGGKVVIIDPLSEDWPKSTKEIINSLYRSLIE